MQRWLRNLVAVSAILGIALAFGVPRSSQTMFVIVVSSWLVVRSVETVARRLRSN